MNAISKKLLSLAIVLAMVLSMTPVITLPAAAATDPDTIISTANSDDFKADFASGVTTVENVVCPVCGEAKTWTAFGTATSSNQKSLSDDHMYLNGNANRTGETSVTGSANQTCLFLNGFELQVSGQLRLQKTLNIIGEGRVTRNASDHDFPMFTMASANSKVSIYGGTYTNNDADKNMFELKTATSGTPFVKIYGGSFTNSSSDTKAVSLTSSKMSFEVYGGSIAGNVQVDAGTMKLDGGSITGNVQVNAGTLTLSGNPTIAAPGLSLAGGVTANVTDLEDGSIAVTGAADTPIATGGDPTKAALFKVYTNGEVDDTLKVTADASGNLTITAVGGDTPASKLPEGFDSTNFKNNISGWLTTYADLFDGTSDVKTDYCPVCGAEDVTWEARSSSSATLTIKDEAKHYYLTEDCGKTTKDMIGDSHGKTGCIYLNNHTYTTIGRFLIKNKLNIFDDNQTGGGGITKLAKTVADAEADSKTAYYELAMLAVAGGELNIYGGHYESQQPIAVSTDGATTYNPNGTPVIKTTNSGKVNIYDGTFANNGAGAVIQMTNGDVTMTGGTIQRGSGYVDGENTLGGNVYVAGGTFKLDGGIIGLETRPETNMATNGGNVYVAGGTFTVKSGTVRNGTAIAGGNVYVAADGTLTMEANGTGTITGGKADDTDNFNTDGGGNVANFGTFTMNGGTISSGIATHDGGNIYNYGTTCTLAGTITGGNAVNGGSILARARLTVDTGADISGGNATNGGNLYSRNATLTLKGGKITGGTAVNGGNVYKHHTSNGVLNISGTTVSNGTATGNGGNIYAENELNLSGTGKITGGTAVNGGAVYLSGCTMEMTGGSIEGGVAGVAADADPTEDKEVQGTAGKGGNVYVADDSTFTLSAGTISNGTAHPQKKGDANDAGEVEIVLTDGNGGNIYAAGALTLSGTGEITGGSANNGASVYLSGCTMNMTGGSITGGTASTYAGSVYVPSGAVLNMSSGSITGGTANTKGDATDQDNYSSSVYVTSGGTANLSGDSIITGTADSTCSALIVTGSTNSAGTVNLSGTAKVILDDNSTFTSEKASAMRVFRRGVLRVNTDWDGEACAYIYTTWDIGQKLEHEKFPADQAQWGTVGDSFQAGGTTVFTGNLYQYDGKKIFGMADGSLQVAGAALVTEGASGSTTWVKDGNAAIQEIADRSYDYLWLSGDVTLNGEEITVNMAGSGAITITGRGTVYGIDTANTDFTTAGSGTLYVDSEEITVETEAKDMEDNRYLALGDNLGNYSFHCFKINLTHVTLRPAEAGLYYKAAYTCDDTLAGRVNMYGVILDVEDIPLAGDMRADFKNEQYNYTGITDGFTPDAVTHTVNANSGGVFGIIKADSPYHDANPGRAESEFFANAYIAVNHDNSKNTPDKVIVGIETANGGSGWSLHSVVKALDADEKWKDLGEKQTLLKNAYAEWATWGINWSDLENIANG